LIPLGVCVLREADKNRARSVSYPNYIFEILAHAGLFHTKIAEADLEKRLAELRVLVTVGDVDFAPSLRTKLTEWVESGGAWISIGGVCAMEQLLGVARLGSTYKNWGGGSRSLGEGYLDATGHMAWPMFQHLNRPLHFFGGVAVEAKGATVLAKTSDAHGRPTDIPAVLHREAGKGATFLIAPDLTGTVVHVQQGRGGVTRDGVPAPDGTSPVNDSVLKSDDGAVLDWLLDREPVKGADGLSIFVQPVADLWRQLLIRTILHCAQATSTPLPILWYWPRKLPAVGHLSHDTDGNVPALAHKLLETLAAGEVKSTWCVILPGYDAELMAKIKSAGHEFATHYDAMSDGLHWSAEQFDRQFRELRAMFGGEQPVTNKNHYLRWENDTDIWDWCLKHGIQLDQSKGASKTGEAGFNFGTCHPYFPVRFDGRPIDVLELATPTQDLVVFAPEAIFEPLLAQAKEHHGVLHLLFHPAHFNNLAVPAAMSTAIRRGKQEGLEWWTARQINAWERARRTVRVAKMSGDSVTLEADAELADATVLVLSGGVAPVGLTGDGSFTAWSFKFHSATTTIRPGIPQRIDVE
jgi:hypothetical protein